MIEIRLDDDVIKVKPYMTIEQYQKFLRKEELYKKSPVDLLSLWLKIPTMEIKDLPVEDVKLVENYITQELSKDFNEDKLYDCFEFEGVEYGLENDWSKLAWGAWVDFQVLSAQNIQDNIHSIMAILYRPVLKKDKNGKYEIKPYKASEIQERAELFKELPMRYWLGAASFFFSNIHFIHKQYKEFFDIDEQVKSVDDEGMEDTPKMDKAQITNRFYFALTFQLAQEDITKFEQIDSMNVYLCLNAASIFKERRLKEEEEFKKLQSKMKK